MSNLKEEVEKFLRRNFPQIQMHGGAASVTILNADEGRVSVALGGACGGCGLSPMTIDALKRRLPDQVDGVEQVDVSVGMDQWGAVTPSTSGERDGPDAPF